MSNTQRCRGLTVAVVALGVAVAMPQAYAFNPQPDPPAKQKLLDSSTSFKSQKSLNSDKAFIGSKNAVQSGPCKPGVSCGAVDMYKGNKK